MAFGTFLKKAGFAALGFWAIAGAVKPEMLLIPDGANLLFHEAGHVFFGLFGNTVLGIWGGTLGQLAFPAGLAVAFHRKRQKLEALVMAWWFGENLLGISRYMADARDQALPRVGGEIHDWNYLLLHYGLLDGCRPIASAIWVCGLLIMICAAAKGAAGIRQKKSLPGFQLEE